MEIALMVAAVLALLYLSLRIGIDLMFRWAHRPNNKR
jgi:hypothetical protein